MGTNSIFSFLRSRHGGSGSKKTLSVSRPFSGRFIEASYGRDATVLFCGSRTEEERKAAVTHLKTAIAAAERQHQRTRKVGRKRGELATAAPQEGDGGARGDDDDMEFWASCPGTPDGGDWCEAGGVDIFAIGESSSGSDSGSDSGLGLGDRSPRADPQADMVAAWVAAQCSLVEEGGYDGGSPEWCSSTESLPKVRGTDILDAMMAEGKSLNEAVAIAAAAATAAPRRRYSMAYSDAELWQESELRVGCPGADLRESERYPRRAHSTGGGRGAGMRGLGCYADHARTIDIRRASLT
ncbi:hypothetical protein ACRE_046960 [Hapsidospora chrysogenum ATCC 11550]|uniref:Uncharacterized protein n=1 Tax=Hapsidospora chrysogenum (strain ATCC 11550 / CBS 779.69 / DSM 880 / IAM 14645 / JCM 23072 / IMI 49137) TaxID=857340 RepID=A0A086T578_HAPC1|nr:hypothetical protein ACRE_046960 [Hapsidospora chrysogenum ATCC 11550]